jgi:hypothetical protein
MESTTRHRWSCVALTIVAVVSLAGCHDGDVMSARVGFSERWVVATLDEGNGWYANEQFLGDTTPVVVPDTVPRGLPFPVKIYTWSGGCTSFTDSVNIETSGDTALLIPFDHVYSPVGGRFACLSILYQNVRTTQLAFSQAGQARIEIRGWKNGPPNGLITLAKVVVVSP